MLRTALALSTITGKPFRMTNIRGSRPRPGLKHQHLKAVEAIRDLSSAEIKGAELGSRDLEFSPNDLKSGQLDIDMGTAGSITLLLQCTLPLGLYKEIDATIIGGTDVEWSMPYDYLDNVLLPFYRRYCDVEMQLSRRGYYPKGGGKVRIMIRPRKREPLVLEERGSLISIRGVSHASSDLRGARVAERQAEIAKSIHPTAEIKIEYADTLSTGSGITMWADHEKTVIGSDELGRKGVPAEQVGRRCAERLMAESGPCDEHLADNLVVLVALLGGRLKYEKTTDHMRSNIEVCRKFLEIEDHAGVLTATPGQAARQ